MRGGYHGVHERVPPWEGGYLHTMGGRHIPSMYGRWHIPSMYGRVPTQHGGRLHTQHGGRLHTYHTHPGYIHHLVYPPSYYTLGTPRTSRTWCSTGSSGLGAALPDDEALGSSLRLIREIEAHRAPLSPKV